MDKKETRYSPGHCIVDIVAKEGREFLEVYPEFNDDHKRQIVVAAQSHGSTGGRCVDCAKQGEFRRNGSIVKCEYYNTLQGLLDRIGANKD